MTENQYPTSDSEGSEEGGVSHPEPSAPPVDEKHGPSPAAAVASAPIPPDDSVSDPAPSTEGEALSNDENARATASGIFAGILGLLLGGPILALLFGGGTAYVATTRSDAAGDAARSLGDVALTARDRAAELNEKHHITDKTREAAGQAWERTKEKAAELEGRHHVVDRTRAAAESAYHKAVEIDREHHIVERAVSALGSLWALISSKIWTERGGEEGASGIPPAQATNSATGEGSSAPPTAAETTPKA